MESTITHDSLGAVLHRDEISIDPAELHGLLCAVLSGQPQLTIEGWLTAALGEPITPGYLDTDAKTLLGDLHEQTRGQLAGGEFALQLMLPDDEEPLSARTEALVQWCSGYLSGLGHLGFTDFSQWPQDTSEFVADLTEISKADFVNADEAPDEDSWVELVEYARVGAMLVYETLRGAAEDEVVH